MNDTENDSKLAGENSDSKLAVQNGLPAQLPAQIPPDAKQLRTAQVGRLLDSAYQGASCLKLSRDEAKKLREDFPDDAVEIRQHDGIIYISHMTLRERLWDVFGPGSVAEICRERMVRTDSNEIAVDLVLMIKGKFVAEGIGTAKYFPNNPKGSFGDTVESAWSDALRRCCKKFGVGTQVWRPAYVREWLAANAAQGYGGKWQRVAPKQAAEAARAPEEPLKFVKGSYVKRKRTAEPELPAQEPEPTKPEDDDIPF